ncbi:MAG: TetR/AcrR family transcriptional regulator [Candidatus Promineifilaceae bacterium]|jgi:AcrR family transcriptional regulator
MSPKPDVSTERKQQIFEAAVTCFGRQGYHLTTMDDIAAECGLSKGSLYWYFNSKKELFLYLFSVMMEQTDETWGQIIDDENLTATEKLRNTLSMFGPMMEDWASFFGVMLEAWGQTRFDEDVEELMHNFYKPYITIMKQILQEGVDNGEFWVTSPEATAAVILSLYDGMSLAKGMDILDIEWQLLADAAMELVFGSITGEGSRGSK